MVKGTRTMLKDLMFQDSANCNEIKNFWSFHVFHVLFVTSAIFLCCRYSYSQNNKKSFAKISFISNASALIELQESFLTNQPWFHIQAIFFAVSHIKSILHSKFQGNGNVIRYQNTRFRTLWYYLLWFGRKHCIRFLKLEKGNLQHSELGDFSTIIYTYVCSSQLLLLSIEGQCKVV